MEQRNIEQQEKTLETCSSILKYSCNWASREKEKKEIGQKK